MNCRAICIRGVIASASLKHRRRQARHQPLPVYPRRYRLGLIEASSGDTLDGLSIGIRGVIASASLKPVIGNELSKRKDMYPRRYRLGLIEARVFIGLRSLALVCIRGVIASASLKP